jgi:hypothetical protein
MPVRFLNVDDVAVRAEIKRHHIVSERRDEAAGESEILCSCGLSVKLPKAESALDLWSEHFLAALKGSHA